ncbi:hypothetical protein PEC311524_43400 [Pectobacterium carotovorum subsp. carotovorum]|uniref:Uncharacterized protein n=1 Tax=Pectobacterium polonicum TaxID=2485124 RepID=A0ABV1PBV4_9GAMM|nr:hypothetical protein [Pectobacterium polonicum]MDC9820813.1 hypothetical protein [Pectobacterium polonicum]GKW26746.1 hypothetical protein PEC311524_43400 [Pectobacterium carotovorum subsp. carotovorum]
MFNRNALILFLKNQSGTVLLDVVYPRFSVQHYTAEDFTSVESEQRIGISRAPKTATDNGLLFWIYAELAEGLCNPEHYLLNAYFKRIDEATFNTQVKNYCGDLRHPPALPLSNQLFLGALLMYEPDTDMLVSIFAEYEQEYLHFFWESTA